MTTKAGRKSKYRFDEILVNVGDKDYHLYENAPQIRQAVFYWAKTRNKKVVTHLRSVEGVELLEIELIRTPDVGQLGLWGLAQEKQEGAAHYYDGVFDADWVAADKQLGNNF